MSSGISSSDRLRGQTYNPLSRSQRTTVRLAGGQANLWGAQALQGFPLWRHHWDWAPNPVCCGATDEGLVAVATRPGCPYSPAAAGEGEHSRGRAGRWVQSKIWWPSCCSLLPWSMPWDKTSYSVALWQQHLYQENTNKCFMFMFMCNILLQWPSVGHDQRYTVEFVQSQKRNVLLRAYHTNASRGIGIKPPEVFWPPVVKRLCPAVLTYTLAILEESECAVPRVQMDSNDGSLSKPGREVHLVSFMMQQAWEKKSNTDV